ATHGVAAVDYSQPAQRLAVGTADGKFSLVDIAYRPSFADDGSRTVNGSLKTGPLIDIGRAGVPVEAIGYADGGSRKLAVASQVIDGRRELHAVTLAQKRTL